MLAPSGPLPFVDDMPHTAPVVAAARDQVARQASAQREFEAHQAQEAEQRRQAAAQLPSAARLKEMAEDQVTHFDFEGYTLWRVEKGGLQPSASGTEWVLTNPYGVDYCMRLRDLEGFQAFLDKLRNNEAIGAEPEPMDDELPHHWADGFTTSDWCEPVDDAVARIVAEASHLDFGVHGADPGCWVDFRATVFALMGERLS